jgi:putative membrane protein
MIVLHAVLTFLFFSYRITDDSVLVREGVVFKKQLDLAFIRIQNVTFEHPFYFRPLGLVTVKIDGAGSSGEEVYLSALEAEAAQAIRREILARKAAFADQLTADADEYSIAPMASDDQGELLITRSLPDLVLAGLTNNRAWIILGGFAAVFGQFNDVVFALFTSWGFDVREIVEHQTTGGLILLFLSSLILSVIIVAALSVLGAIFSYYDFTLHGTSKSFTVRRGLFTKHEIHMQKSRIQNIYFRQDWLDRVLGRVNLIFEQISHGASRTGRLRQGATDKKLLVPTITEPQALQLSRTVLPLVDFEALQFTTSSKRYFFKKAAIWSFVYLAVGTSLASTFFDQGWWVLVLLPPVWCLHLVKLFVQWKRKGIAIDGDLAVIRLGFIGIDYIVIPAHKLQIVWYTQSLLMKRHDLASIGLKVASRAAQMPFIYGQVARQVINYCLYQTESTDRSWM